MVATFHIDSSACIRHAYLLDQIGKSAIPVAVRQTLNQAAFDTKKRVQDNSKNPFIHRRLTFFKASSSVNPAKGLDVNTMQSEVGFTPNPLKKTRNDHSVQDLEQQENGGLIGGKAFIPLNAARNSKSPRRMVKENYRMSVLENKIVRASANKKGKNKGQRFILSSIFAHVGIPMANAKDGFIMGEIKGGKRYLFKINSVHRPKGARNTFVNSTAIYSVEKGRKVTPGSKGGAHHHFMRNESLLHVKAMEANFVKFAEIKIKQVALKQAVGKATVI